MKPRLTKFAVFCNRTIAEIVKAKDFDDLIENRMLKRQKEFWSSVNFKDDEDRTICITREFLDDQGMTFDEVVLDWLEFAEPSQLESPITFL